MKILEKRKKNYLEIEVRTDKYFSITGSLFESTRKRNFEEWDLKEINGKIYECTTCGCIHDTILKYRPDLKILVDLHLSNLQGEPMYALENGFYHLQGYMGTAKFDHKMNKKDVANYLRVTEDEIQELADKNVSKLEFATFLNTKVSQWKQEAEEAKKLIETLV